MWAIAKRVFLFAMVNLLVIVTLSILWTVVSSFLGIQTAPYGYDGMSNFGVLPSYGPLLAFCAVFGMGGAFISLQISRWMAKRMMGVQVIDPQTRDPQMRAYVDMVHGLARRAGLRTMPEVGIYQNPEVNAFATGPSKARSLVAVSSGLLNRMDSGEVEAVVGHEIAHVANGDMVTMTLIQGIVNTFVMFLARIVASIAANSVEERSRFMVQMAVTIVLEILLTFLGLIVVNAFSRHREFRADFGGAKLTGRDRMIAALRALQKNVQNVDNEHESLAAFKINGKTGSLMARLFSTHPPLEERIARLEKARLA